MLNLASILEAFAQRADPAPSSGRTALQLGTDERFRQLSLVKRLFDVLAAAAALLVLSPLLAALALVVRLAIGAPITLLLRVSAPGIRRSVILPILASVGSPPDAPVRRPRYLFGHSRVAVRPWS